MYLKVPVVRNDMFAMGNHNQILKINLYRVNPIYYSDYSDTTEQAPTNFGIINYFNLYTVGYSYSNQHCVANKNYSSDIFKKVSNKMATLELKPSGAVDKNYLKVKEFLDEVSFKIFILNFVQ